MRRRLLALFVPVIAASLAAPSLAAAADSSPVAGKSTTVSTTDSKTLKSPKATTDSGRRWL